MPVPFDVIFAAQPAILHPCQSHQWAKAFEVGSRSRKVGEESISLTITDQRGQFQIEFGRWFRETGSHAAKHPVGADFGRSDGFRPQGKQARSIGALLNARTHGSNPLWKGCYIFLKLSTIALCQSLVFEQTGQHIPDHRQR